MDKCVWLIGVYVFGKPVAVRHVVGHKWPDWKWVEKVTGRLVRVVVRATDRYESEADTRWRRL